MIKIFQQVLQMCLKQIKNREPQQRHRRYKEELSGYFRNENTITEDLLSRECQITNVERNTELANNCYATTYIITESSKDHQ